MRALFLKLLLKLRYRLSFQGMEEVRKGEAILGISLWTSQLDPFLLSALGLSWTVLVPRQALTQPWLRRLASFFNVHFIPRYSDKGRGFYAKRLHLGLQKLSLKGNLCVFAQGKFSPLLFDILTKEKKRIVFVHIQGMKGSDFSATPRSWKHYFTLLLKNGLFFIPKREICITFSSVEEGFPFTGQLEEMNQYALQRLSKFSSLPQAVPYYFWKREATDRRQKVIQEVYQELRRLSSHSEIKPEMNLYDALNLDSLDVTELLVFLEKRFHQKGRFSELRTVEDVVATALGMRASPTKGRENHLKAWQEISSRPPVDYPDGSTLPLVFLQSCERMGKALACVDPIEPLSYTRLKTLTLGLVEFCRALPGKYVGLLLPSTNEFSPLVLALIMAGKVPTPLNWTLGAAHLADAAQIAELQVILSTSPLLENLTFDIPDSLAEKIQLVEEIRETLSWEARQSALKLARGSWQQIAQALKLDQQKPEDIAVLLFTSGTEKQPKGVPLSHQNLMAAQKAGFKGIDFRASDVLMGILPPFHVFGFSLTQLLPLLIGCRAIFYPNPMDFQAIAAFIEQWNGTIVCTAPTFLRTLLSLATEPQLQTLRLFIVGAEKLPSTLRDQVPSGIQLLEGYGLTECAPLLTLNAPNVPVQGVGMPAEGVELLVVDPTTHQPVMEGEIGLILASGPNVFKGYLNAPNPFIAVQGKEWLNTGDIGFLNHSGALHLKDRLSRTIKIGGEMISLPVIEKVVADQIAPAQVAIIAKEIAEKTVHLILYCTQKIELDRVNQILKGAGFSNLLRIKEVRIISQLPVTATGKINYRALESNIL